MKLGEEKNERCEEKEKERGRGREGGREGEKSNGNGVEQSKRVKAVC